MIKVFFNKVTRRAAIIPHDKCGGEGGYRCKFLLDTYPDKCFCAMCDDSILSDIENYTGEEGEELPTIDQDGISYTITGDNNGSN